MRISKQVATEIAKKLTEKLATATNEAHLHFSQLVTDAYIAHLPAVIKDTCKKHPDYFKTTGSLRLSGNGFNNVHVATTVRVIAIYDGYNATYEPTEKQAKEMIKAERAYETAKAKYKSVFEQTEVALFNLRTRGNIEKQLPEAVPFLPSDMSTALMPNLDKLRKQLQ